MQIPYDPVIPVIDIASKRLIGVTRVEIPFGVPFKLNLRWWQLSFAGKDAYYVQRVQEPAIERIVRKIYQEYYEEDT